MLWVPQKGIVHAQHNMGTVGSLTPGTSVTTGGTASTKGTPAQIFSATLFDVYWVWICAYDYASAAVVASEGAMDILTGGATEDVLIPNLLHGYCTNGVGPAAGKQWAFPLYIPAGTRIAVQAAGARVSTAFRVCMALYGGSGVPLFRVGTRVTTYGMGTVPNGTTVTPGASAAEGTWTQIVASTTRDHFAFAPSYQPSADTTTNLRGLAVDMGVGAATEEEIMSQAQFNTTASETMSGPVPWFPTFKDVPAGSRLVMRASNSGTNDGAYNGVIHAVD